MEKSHRLGKPLDILSSDCIFIQVKYFFHKDAQCNEENTK